MLLTTILWDAGGDASNWHDPLNWNLDRLPDASDDVRIDQSGDYTVRLSSDVVIESVALGSAGATPTFIIDTASLTVTSGELEIAAGAALSVRGSGSIHGEVVNNGELEVIHRINDGPSSAVTRVFAGQFTNGAGGVLRLLPSNNSGFVSQSQATLTVDFQQGLTNAGRIEISEGASSSDDWGNAVLLVSGGSLLNESTGVIASLLGGGNGTIGSRTISGDITNRGIIDVLRSLTSSDGTVTNHGTIQVDSGIFVITDSLANFSDNSLASGSFIVRGHLRFPNDGILTNAATLTLIGPTAGISNATGANALLNLSDNSAAGILTIEEGQNLTLSAGLRNNGVVTVGVQSTLALAAGNYLQTSGATNVLAEASLNPSGTVELEGGVLGGNGLIAADVINTGGVVRPGGDGSGLLTIDGYYRQTGAGALHVEIGGPTVSTGYDRLVVTEAADLGGVLQASLIDPFQPVLGDHFHVLTSGGRIGEFDAYSGIYLGNNRKFEPGFDATGLTLGVEIANNSPLLDPIDDQQVTEGGLLTFTATATDPDGGRLTFSLDPGAPEGASIDPMTGVFTWTTTEAHGPGAYLITVRATDDGEPVMDETWTFRVVVDEVNQAPLLDPIGDWAVGEGETLTFTAQATDGDLPANTRTFSLVGAPVGASIDSTTGVFTWTPAEAQGPAVFTFTVRVTDGSSPVLSDEETITVTVGEANRAPLLQPIGGRTALVNQPLTFTAQATDPDLPANQLTFSLIGAPSGASIDPNTGVFNWAPTEDQSQSSHTFTIRVTDNGQPALWDEETITVDVRTLTLDLTVTPGVFVESSGQSAAIATVTRNYGFDEDLIVALTSSDPSIVAVPATVIIQAGDASASFVVTAIDNQTVDGIRSLLITATAAGFESGSREVMVSDDDSPTLTLELLESSVAEGGAVTARLSRNWITDESLAISLSSSSAGQLMLPVVTIAAGEASTTFVVETAQNTFPEKDEVLTLTASAVGFADGSGVLTVTDHDDLPTLTITPENATGTENGAGILISVSRAVAVDSPLTVRLYSSDPSVAVPTVSTVVIGAGETSATFTVAPVQNGTADGQRAVTITASGSYVPCGCRILAGSGIATIEILDDDAPSLTLTLSTSSALEGLSAAVTGTVTRNTPTTEDLVVTLSTSDLTEAVAPLTVIIGAGQSSANFVIDTVADEVTDGPQEVTFTAAADGLPTSTAALTVLDIDAPDLTVSEVSLPSAGLSGSDATMSWTVTNEGRVLAAGQWLESVYLSRSEVFDGEAVLLFTKTSSTQLSPGISTRRTAVVALPNEPGRFYAFVVVDSAAAVSETDETNNVARSVGIVDVSPTYKVTVSPNLSSAPLGAPVTLSGTATFVEGGILAANTAVSVRVINEHGIRRVLNATTDELGRYSVEFVPLGNEAGAYRLAAAHPGVADDVIQSEFALVGIRATNATSKIELAPGATTSGSMELVNVGSVPLTSLTIDVLNAPSNVLIAANLSADRIDGNGTIRLAYAVTATDASTLRSLVRLRVVTAEGASLEVTLDLVVVPLRPNLVTAVDTLRAGVVRGQQKLVTFEVANVGGAATGDLDVILPNVPWLTLSSPDLIALA